MEHWVYVLAAGGIYGPFISAVQAYEAARVRHPGWVVNVQKLERP